MAEDNKDNRSLFDILEDMKEAEEDFLAEAENFKQKYKEKSFFNDVFSNLYE